MQRNKHRECELRNCCIVVDVHRSHTTGLTRSCLRTCGRSQPKCRQSKVFWFEHPIYPRWSNISSVNRQGTAHSLCWTNVRPKREYPFIIRRRFKRWTSWIKSEPEVTKKIARSKDVPTRISRSHWDPKCRCPTQNTEQEWDDYDREYARESMTLVEKPRQPMQMPLEGNAENQRGVSNNQICTRFVPGQHRLCEFMMSRASLACCRQYLHPNPRIKAVILTDQTERKSGSSNYDTNE
jgi:hypothetical protein